MNIFRLIGDFSHLLAIIILLFKILKTRSSAGISGKSQILFVIVYVSRYLDLFTTFISIYNAAFKVIFIGASVTTVFLVFYLFRDTYDCKNDVFHIEYLIVPAGLLALMINHAMEDIEILWTFSIYLEAVAIVPQLNLIRKTGEIDIIIRYYLLVLGSYRAWYMLNWIYRYITENHYDLIAIFAGIIQTIVYCEFFIHFVYNVSLFVEESKEEEVFTSKEKPQFITVHTDDDRELRMERAAYRLMTENGLENGLKTEIAPPQQYHDTFKMVFGDIDVTTCDNTTTTPETNSNE